MSAYRTWGFTLRPFSEEDEAFWVSALDSYPNCLQYFGAVEEKLDDDGNVVDGSRHVHGGIVLNKAMKKDTVDKWMVRNLKKSPEYLRRSEGNDRKNFLKVQRAGLELWWSWDWVENYIQSDHWLKGKVPGNDDREWIEPLFAPKGDTGLKTTRKTKPSIPDRIVECWHRDYPGKRPVNGSTVVRRYVAYLMYNSKEIPLIKQRDLSDVYTHVAEMITPPEMPEPQSCEGAAWFVKGQDEGLVC